MHFVPITQKATTAGSVYNKPDCVFTGRHCYKTANAQEEEEEEEDNAFLMQSRLLRRDFFQSQKYLKQLEQTTGARSVSSMTSHPRVLFKEIQFETKYTFEGLILKQ